MSSLAVTVMVNGQPGAGLAVSIYPTSDFVRLPQRGSGKPNASATATGTTDGAGDATLTGLSAVDYQLLVVDARGVNNWFHVVANYVGRSYTATIPWSTPTSVTHPVSVGGDTPGGTSLMSPWAQREHFHEVVVTASVVPKPGFPLSAGYGQVCAVAAPSVWYVCGQNLTINGSATTYHLIKTSSGGSSWVGITDATIGFTAGSFLANDCAASGSSVLILGQNDPTKVFFSSNSGGSFSSHDFGVNVQACAILGSGWYVCTDHVVYESTNSGSTWTAVLTLAGGTYTSGNTTIRAAGDGSCLVFAYVDATNTFQKFYYGSGSSWTSATGTTNEIGSAPFYLTVASTSQWFVSTGPDIWQTTNSGGSFTKVDTNNFGGIAVSSDATRLLLATTGPNYTAIPYTSPNAITPNPFGGGSCQSPAFDGGGKGTWIFVGSPAGGSGGSPVVAYQGA